MANSILIDPNGPDWPLGFISVAVPGTPVGLMSVVDPAGVNNPNTPTSTLTAEYTVRFQQIFFLGYKPGGTTTPQPNAGNVVIIRRPVGAGSGNRIDSGVLVYVLQPGEKFFLGSAAGHHNVFSPYRYFVDADNAGDGVYAIGLVQ